LALNVLYQVDVAKIPVDDALETAIANTDLDDAAQEFAVALVNGTLEHLPDIDEKLTKLSVGWELQRQPSVDRNILRMASFEILYLEHIPDSVAINEAVDMAKKYSTEESGRFINGVLGALVRQYRENKEVEEHDAGTDS
jgi:N utilization substance protein B